MHWSKTSADSGAWKSIVAGTPAARQVIFDIGQASNTETFAPACRLSVCHSSKSEMVRLSVRSVIGQQRNGVAPHKQHVDHLRVRDLDQLAPQFTANSIVLAIRIAGLREKQDIAWA